MSDQELRDLLSDLNSSSATDRRYAAEDLGNLGMICEVDGRPVQIGSTAAILGHPLRSLAAASRIAAQHGFELRPGWVVMAGAATAATYVKPGQHLRVSAEVLGNVDLFVQ